MDTARGKFTRSEIPSYQPCSSLFKYQPTTAWVSGTDLLASIILASAVLVFDANAN